MIKNKRRRKQNGNLVDAKKMFIPKMKASLLTIP